MSLNWPDILTGLIARKDLSGEAARWAMGEILAGAATPVQIAGFAVAMRAKGETVEEISGLAAAMLDAAREIQLSPEAVDVVGSGGDRANTVNISTMAALVAAASGAPVVKHGNRSASSMSGTADCLESLGVVLDLPPQAQSAVLAEAGIVFLFAPFYHPSLRHAAVARRELGISTSFNFLGPLVNPGRPVAQAVGVADRRMAGLMAGVIAGRGNRGLVFHGGDGLDELTTTTASDIWVVADGRVVQTRLDPAELGIPHAVVADLVGGNPAHNAQVARDVLAGRPGPVRDIVLLNAAAAVLAFEGPDPDAPLAEQLAEPLVRAAHAVDSGRATSVLDRWVTVSQMAASG